MASLRWVRCSLLVVGLFYFNVVLSNVISWRQVLYAEQNNNGTSLPPLHDNLFGDWLQIPPQDLFTLRELIDVLTLVWVLLTCSYWWCFGKIEPLARVIAVEVIIVPIFAVAQLLTIVPDSTPHCLETFQIPRGNDTSWIWWRYPVRTCGNMLWSSDFAQLILFAYLMNQTVSRCKWLVWLVSQVWLATTASLILTSRYQYSVDIMTTWLILQLMITHPALHRIARRFLILDVQFFERVPSVELPEGRVELSEGRYRA